MDFGPFSGTLIYSSTLSPIFPSGGLILITLVSRFSRKDIKFNLIGRKKAPLAAICFFDEMWKCFGANNGCFKSSAITGTDSAGGRRVFFKWNYGICIWSFRASSLSLILFLIFSSASCIINVPWIFSFAFARQRVLLFSFLRNAYSDTSSLGAIDYSFLGSAYKFRSELI